MPQPCTFSTKHFLQSKHLLALLKNSVNSVKTVKTLQKNSYCARDDNPSVIANHFAMSPQVVCECWFGKVMKQSRS